jgi:hypothetical protein
MKVIYKILLLLIIFSFYNYALFSQRKNGFRLISGDCRTVIETLRNHQGNDSIAIEIFKNEYIIDKLQEPEKLFQKRYPEIIKFFNTKEGKRYQCRLRDIKIENHILLIN